LQSSGHRFAFGEVEDQSGQLAKTPLSLLQIGAMLVMLIGAVNVANLMMGRANTRRPELAIRLSLGAGRAALLRQMMVESLLLTASATTVGLGLAWASHRVINLYLIKMGWTASPIELEALALAAIVSLALVLGIVFGVLPFAVLWRAGLAPGTSRTASAGSAMRRLSGSLIVGQMAIALVLLVGAGLLIRSFVHVMATDPGFDAAHLVQGRVAAPHAYDNPEKNVALQQRLLETMREIPGVDRVAVSFDPVLAESYRSFPFLLRDTPIASGESKPQANFVLVSPDFFPTMNVRLLDGRLLTEADDRRSSPAALVDDLFVRRYFPDRSPLGQEINIGQDPQPNTGWWFRIVGIVQRPQLTGLEQRDGLPFVFLPMIQQPSAGFTLVVRSARPAGDVLAAMRLKLRQVDPSLPLYTAASLQDGMDDMVRNRRGIMFLIAIFAVLAVLLAGVGLYGVLAYDVTQRTREIGIRGAIGASRSQIIVMILRQGIQKASFGYGIGLLGAFYLTRLLRSHLFDVQPFDPITFGAVSLLLAGIALFASWLPARRAAKVDPVVALRAE
jgi:predicted permease